MRKYDKILEPSKEAKEAMSAYGIKFKKDEICISKGLLQKIIDFFKNLFNKIFKKGDE